MYQEDEYLMLSALQHLLFCERQCWLIHADNQWAENYFTAAGDVMHEKVDKKSAEKIGDNLRIERGLMIKSSSLGLSGKADAVEFHKQADGSWLPFPVEYKLGKPKPDDCDKVQLCAQALCLEEMLGLHVPAGALFYGKTRHRLEVVFSPELRAETQDACKRLHQLIPYGKPPPPEYVPKKCDSCSLKDLCMPKSLGIKHSAASYIESVLESL